MALASAKFRLPLKYLAASDDIETPLLSVSLKLGCRTVMILENIVGMVRRFRKTPTHTTIKCQRCISGEPALYRVSSDIMRVNVCEACAADARSLGLKVHPASSNNKHAA